MNRSGGTAGNQQRKLWFIIAASCIPLAALATWVMITAGGVSTPLLLFVAIPAVIFTAWRGKIEMSSTLLIGTIASSALVAISWINNVGILAAILFALVSAAVATQVLVGENRTAALGVTSVVTLTIIFIDLFSPLERLSLPQNGNLIIFILTLVAAAVFVFLVLRDFQNYNLRTKFLTSVALLAITAVVVNILFTTYTSRRIAFDTAGTTLKSRALEKAELLSLNMQSSIERLLVLPQDANISARIFQQNSTYSRRTESEIAGILDRYEAIWQGEAGETSDSARSALSNYPAAQLLALQTQNPEWSHLTLLDREGGTIALTEFVTDYDHSDEVWWQTAIEGEVFVGEPRFDAQQEEETLRIAVPLNDDFGRPIAVLSGVYRLSSLFALTVSADSRLDESAGDLNIVIGRTLLATTENGLEIEETDLDTTLFDQIEAQSYVLQPFAGEPSLVAVASVPEIELSGMGGIDFRILTHVSEASVANSFTTQQRGQVFIGLATILVAAAAAVIVGNIITRPLVDLKETAERLAGGDLDARATILMADEIGILGGAFNSLADQVSTAVTHLERSVAERTQALQTTFRVSRSLASIIDRDELIEAIVSEIKEAFNYYHVHIYLLDEREQLLRLAAGSGEAGKELLRRRHALPLGRGLVGRAAAGNQAQLVSDVSADKNWTPNELLPETRAELAVPISFGNQVLGVIDVQESVIGRLSLEDLELLQAIAAQTAIALRNAAYVEAAQNRAEQAALINQIREKIIQTRDIDDAVKVAARELAQATGGRAAVRLTRPLNQDGAGQKQENFHGG